MAKLKYYKTTKEKSKQFDYHKVDTKNEFDKIYQEQLKEQKEQKEQKSKNLIYRGCNNATFKLYNSAQRHWIQKELYSWGIDFHDFIQQEINNAKSWQNGLLVKFYKSFGHTTAYDLAVLSFLQHYAAPSPLLDWTYSLDNSLFFAINGQKHDEYDGLENYCSVYIINKGGYNNNELINYANLHNQGISELEYLKKQNELQVSFDEMEKKFNEFRYDLIKDTPMVYISDFENDDTPSMYTNTNFNIINQEGLFIFNNNPTEPLEFMFKGRDNIEEGDTFHLTKITCIDIHKNLVEHIRDLLMSKGVTNKFIFPQEEDLAWESFISFLK